MGKIPEVIKNKIVAEANWRSTNGHGGVDDQLRDEFINHAEFGYQLATQQEGLRWVKASERLQNDDHEFVFLKGCRVDKGILRREFNKPQQAWFVTLYYNDGFGTQELTSWREGHEELNKIEWLDESSPNQLQQEIEEVEETAKSFRGYSLLRISELEKERDELKGLCHELWNKQYPEENLKYVQDEWQQFKTENNL